MKSRYVIDCIRCGYVWTGKKGSRQLIEMVSEDGGRYRLCEKCIADIGRAETEEEQKKIIEEGRMKFDGTD